MGLVDVALLTIGIAAVFVIGVGAVAALIAWLF